MSPAPSNNSVFRRYMGNIMKIIIIENRNKKEYEEGAG